MAIAAGSVTVVLLAFLAGVAATIAQLRYADSAQQRGARPGGAARRAAGELSRTSW